MDPQECGGKSAGMLKFFAIGSEILALVSDSLWVLVVRSTTSAELIWIVDDGVGAGEGSAGSSEITEFERIGHYAAFVDCIAGFI